jgi:hypothetical protein
MKLVNILAIISIIFLFSCSSNKTTTQNINGNEVEMTYPERYCLVCQNSKSDYINNWRRIGELKKEKRAIYSKLQEQYGFNVPTEIDNKYTGPITLDIIRSQKKLNALANNKCYQFYYSFGDDGNIYSYVRIPSYLTNNDGKYFQSIDAVTVNLNNGNKLTFKPIGKNGISQYNAGTSFIHLVSENARNIDKEYLMKSRIGRISVIFNTNIQSSAIIN